MKHFLRDILLTVTYAVVLFSIIVQGLTLGPIAKWLVRKPQAKKSIL